MVQSKQTRIEICTHAELEQIVKEEEIDFGRFFFFHPTNISQIRTLVTPRDNYSEEQDLSPLEIHEDRGISNPR